MNNLKKKKKKKQAIQKVSESSKHRFSCIEFQNQFYQDLCHLVTSRDGSYCGVNGCKVLCGCKGWCGSVRGCGRCGV